MANKKELVKELEAKVKDFEERSVWAAKKSEAAEEAAAKTKSAAYRTRCLKSAAKYEGEAEALNSAAWELKGIIIGFGN